MIVDLPLSSSNISYVLQENIYNFLVVKINKKSEKLCGLFLEECALILYKQINNFFYSFFQTIYLLTYANTYFHRFFELGIYNLGHFLLSFFSMHVQKVKNICIVDISNSPKMQNTFNGFIKILERSFKKKCFINKCCNYKHVPLEEFNKNIFVVNCTKHNYCLTMPFTSIFYCRCSVFYV